MLEYQTRLLSDLGISWAKTRTHRTTDLLKNSHKLEMYLVVDEIFGVLSLTLHKVLRPLSVLQLEFVFTSIASWIIYERNIAFRFWIRETRIL